MALVKDTLKAGILAAFKAQQKKEADPDAALNDLADKLATAIDTYIKSGTVTTVVTGACATPAGPGTINGSGTGSVN